jgi:1-hydroxycarotenoid 3,4-desaturase
MARSTLRAVVIGAGIGGLSAALSLAARGLDVTVAEAAETPGGKMRQIHLGGFAIDAGPTVMTLRGVFDELFAAGGESLDDHVTLTPAACLARHAWDGRGHFDLLADREASADAIGRFFGAKDARNYLAFCAEAKAMHDTLDTSFMRAERPSPLGLFRSAGLAALTRTRPFDTLWSALAKRFADPRLAQLFARYATYCGASPYAAPATLMLIAHVEQEGVWLVEGGMHALAQAMAALCAARGATMRYGARVSRILVRQGRACGVALADGEEIEADIVVANADSNSLAQGLFGEAVTGAVRPTAENERALSAVTWCLAAKADGFPLTRHNVFFSRDYRAEFDDIAAGRTPRDPTVYLCAQARDDAGRRARSDTPEEPMLLIVNAPACGDAGGLTFKEAKTCEDRTFATLRRCGLTVTMRPEHSLMTAPQDFEALFPATGGSLYGRAIHGPWASFRRPGARTSVPGLYLAGGSVHPGAGVPMVALSGMIAARSAIADPPSAIPASRAPSPKAAMPGGISMR